MKIPRFRTVKKNRINGLTPAAYKYRLKPRFSIPLYTAVSVDFFFIGWKEKTNTKEEEMISDRKRYHLEERKKDIQGKTEEEERRKYVKASPVTKSYAFLFCLKKRNKQTDVCLIYSQEFRAHDRSHPRSSEIHAEAEHISKQLIDHGHESDRSWITRPIGSDETIE